ncbi:MAG: protein kinase [Anaerolineae bacterium]|nr:protein kinase [Anaerolineae bacterium]
MADLTTIGNRYVLQRELGKGGMGAVYQVLDRLNGQEIALKRVLLPPSKLSFASMTATTEVQELYLALAQEFRLMASLRHPNVNSVLDYGFDAKRQPYFTMELLRDAKTLLRALWGKSDAIKVQLLIEVLQALAYLHRRDLIHRDLKPGNIMVVNGHAKVLDFGLSITADQIDPNAEVIAGTVGYIAPEVLIGQPVSAASDLYAVGVIAFEVLTNSSLFSSQDTKVVLTETLDKNFDLSAIRDKKIKAVVARLLAKDVENRYPSAEDAIVAFSQAIDMPVPKETRAIRESFLQAARFVGRVTEYNTLLDTLLRAVAGQGSIHIIGGESGSGKTRLLDEIRVQALVQGMLVTRGQNLAEGNAPYYMWRNPLRMLLLNTTVNDDEASILKQVLPDIGVLLGRDVPDAPEVSPLLAQGRLLTTIEKVFERQTQPLLIILEDLHWAGAESLGVLLRLNKLIASHKWLILGSYRDDERIDLPKVLPGIPVMKLNRLSVSGIVELSVAILGDKGRQPRLIEFLQRETEGNAFFLVEIMRTLSEQTGRLGSVSEMELPAQIMAGGINQIIQTRLSKVPDFVRPLLRIAAVAGRQLDLKVLREFVASDDELNEWLTTISYTAVLDVQDTLWRFAHDKLRDGVLADMPSHERRELHRQIAAKIETVHLLRINEFTASLVYHWGQGADTEKEAHYAALGAKQALSSGAHQNAIKYADKALELLGRELGVEKKLAAQHAIAGEAYMGMGEHDRARERFHQQLSLCQQANYKWGATDAYNELGMVSIYLGELDNAKDCFLQSLQQAMNIRAQALALSAILGLGILALKTGRANDALDLVTFVEAHPAIDGRTRTRAKEMLDILERTTWPEQLSEAKTKAASTKLNVNDIAKQLMETR